MKYGKPMLVLALALVCVSLQAAPAAWYRWRIAESNVDICSQASPGEGWVAVKGPYQDAVCKKLGMPR